MNKGGNWVQEWTQTSYFLSSCQLIRMFTEIYDASCRNVNCLKQNKTKQNDFFEFSNSFQCFPTISLPREILVFCLFLSLFRTCVYWTSICWFGGVSPCGFARATGTVSQTAGWRSEIKVSSDSGPAGGAEGQMSSWPLPWLPVVCCQSLAFPGL